MVPKRRIVVLISSSEHPGLSNVEISLVLSDRKAAYGLTRAPFLKPNPGKTWTDYDTEIAKIALQEKPDLIVLAGWMHVLGEGFLDLVYTRERPIPVINLHPALPGEFDGKITCSGAMGHRVVKQVDRGEPLVVREIPFEKNEALEAYEERLHKVEKEIIVTGGRMVLDKVEATSELTFFVGPYVH
ncbi:phosphoribosylglycinamide formyltransferase [Armillaria novae-zelandiae]|uniref:phosphoribosylglycinamide formyltransferase 1 n=1 Tax=Armillaria novae-zelandiae TaxID=153914 RepID=A0AA39PPC5_9AGAR|nr:phosphoribosylglycinamide formyltransferase [Armillaria novae-zelandiae]